MKVNPSSDPDTGSDSGGVEHTANALIEAGSGDVDDRLDTIDAHNKLRKRLDEVEESERVLMDFVTMLDERTGRFAKLRNRLIQMEQREKKMKDFIKMLDDRTRHLDSNDIDISYITTLDKSNGDDGAIAEDESGSSLGQDGSLEYYPRDCYSFLALHNPFIKDNRFIFFFGVLAFLFQILLLLGLILSISNPELSSYDVIDGTDPMFPGDVEPIVKVVQGLSILVHVFFPDHCMHDLITAVNLFPIFHEAQEDDPVAGLVVSSCLRFIQSLTANYATFLLIFTSNTGKEVLLNFAAINFISRLDDSGFSSVLKGYYGSEMREKAMRVKEKRLPACITNKKHPFLRSYVVNLSTLVALIICSSVFVLIPQTKGDFLTDIFRIEVNQVNGYLFNGCYAKKEVSFFSRVGLISKRPIYQRVSDIESRTKATIAFCKKEQRWYFFLTNPDDACKAVELKQHEGYSSLSYSFDIKNTFSEPFFSKSGKTVEIEIFTEGAAIEGDGCAYNVGDGKCDHALNGAPFDYDGGDCCAATCDQPMCGIGVVDRAFDTDLDVAEDGYQNCLDPRMVDIDITLHNIIQVSYVDPESFQVKNSTPLLLRFDCDGINHLTITIQQEMEDKLETIKVEEGSKCKIVIKAGYEVDFTLVQPITIEDTTFMPTIFSGTINNATTGGELEFQVVPNCYFERLFGLIDFNTVYSGGRRRKALDWLMSDIATRNSDCDNPFFIERYAIADVYFSATYSDFDDGSSLPELPKEMTMHEGQCSWRFVTCIGGHVAELHLDNLMSSSPGIIATEIALLSELKVLDLAGSNLNGNIPTELGNLSNLEHLDLDHNKLNGTIPTELGVLSSLTWLELHHNQLSGVIPSELGMLSNVELLDLSYNQFTGS
mmetsp:Transcript_9577/g.14029  ORF Transcript_9577/g.14029 Transcript_9577/m.14029 type:complete len:884 (+) Transcript_9577:131-2782(+)